MHTLSDLERDWVATGELVGVSEAESLLEAPSGSRPRMYAYLDRGEYAGQRVALRSQENLRRYYDDIQFIWVSGTRTIYDMIKEA